MIVAKHALAGLEYLKSERLGLGVSALRPVHSTQSVHGGDNLGVVHRMKGRYAEAESLHLTTLEVCKRILGDDHPATPSR